MKRIAVAVLTIVMMLSMSVCVYADSVTKAEAKKIALKDSNLTASQIKNYEIEKEGKKWEIEFTKKKNKAEYDYKISATSGKVLEKSVDYVYKKNKSKKKIGKAAAQKKVAAFSKIKLSIIKKGTVKFERDDGQGEYSVKFKKGHYKYDYTVLAPTGKIIEFERDYVR